MVASLMMKYCTRGLILNDNVLSIQDVTKDSVTAIAFNVEFLFYGLLVYEFFYVEFATVWNWHFYASNTNSAKYICVQYTLIIHILVHPDTLGFYCVKRAIDTHEMKNK